MLSMVVHVWPVGPRGGRWRTKEVMRYVKEQNKVHSRPVYGYDVVDGPDYRITNASKR